MDGGRVVSTHHKSLLPTYDVFDEARYFEPARAVAPALVRGRRLAVTICEDMWTEEHYWPRRRHGRNPIRELSMGGADLILNHTRSPWHRGKHRVREELVAGHARASGLPFVFVNQVAGQDDLVFDGTCLVAAPDGRIVGRAKEFEEDLIIFDEDRLEAPLSPPPAGGEVERVFRALVLGTRDYVEKSGAGFKKALVGLSGGIDSAVTACLAAAALGAENVVVVRMPSRFSSSGSLDDADALARSLGIELLTVPIDPIFEAYLVTLRPAFGEERASRFEVAEENIQSRIRGNILMALSNKLGHIVLSTGNKSELAVGYCTLYGDMSGGLAVISDVPTTLISDLARWINAARGAPIPESSLTKPPSAELRPNQRVEDSLPPYDVLDRVLEAYIVVGKDSGEIVAAGIAEPSLVRRVIDLVDRNEYKRKQAAPGLRVTNKAFGVGRRMPIVQRTKREG